MTTTKDLQEMDAKTFYKHIHTMLNTRGIDSNDMDEILRRFNAYEAVIELASSYCTNTGGDCEDCGSAGKGKKGCPGRIIMDAINPDIKGGNTANGTE